MEDVKRNKNISIVNNYGSNTVYFLHKNLKFHMGIYDELSDENMDEINKNYSNFNKFMQFIESMTSNTLMQSNSQEFYFKENPSKSFELCNNLLIVNDFALGMDVELQNNFGRFKDWFKSKF